MVKDENRKDLSHRKTRSKVEMYSTGAELLVVVLGFTCISKDGLKLHL